MNFGQTRVRLVETGVALAVAALVAGCGNNYRSAVTTTSPSGPASQPTSLVAVLSVPSPVSGVVKSGIASIFDYSGDSLVARASVGVGPTAFAIDSNGSNGYTLNSDDTMTTVPISSTLQQKQITYTTLPAAAQPVNLFVASSGLWAADLTGIKPTTLTTEFDWSDVSAYSGADRFSIASSPATWVLSIPIAPTPVMVAGLATSTSRFFSISQGNSTNTNGGTVAENISSAVACNSPSTVTVNGEAEGIDTANNIISSHIPLGICPVYAIASSDGQRIFVLNRGSDTISVIDTAKDKLDDCTPFTDSETGRTVTCHPTLPLSTDALTATGITPVNCTLSTDSTCGGMRTTAGPVYAEYNAATSLLVVANYDGGTISVIDVSLDKWGNDSANFGKTYTIPVGTNPASVTVLYEGDHAYAANQADQTVSVVNLSDHKVEKTLSVTGHPRTVVSIQNSEYGKVYVASPDSNVLTIISTGGLNPNSVTAAPTVQGNIVDVRVQYQDGTSANANTESRTPGYGQPCNLPLSEFDPASSATATLALKNCAVQDKTLLQ